MVSQKKVQPSVFTLFDQWLWYVWALCTSYQGIQLMVLTAFLWVVYPLGFTLLAYPYGIVVGVVLLFTAWVLYGVLIANGIATGWQVSGQQKKGPVWVWMPLVECFDRGCYLGVYMLVRTLLIFLCIWIPFAAFIVGIYMSYVMFWAPSVAFTFPQEQLSYDRLVSEVKMTRHHLDLWVMIPTALYPTLLGVCLAAVWLVISGAVNFFLPSFMPIVLLGGSFLSFFASTVLLPTWYSFVYGSLRSRR